MSWPPQLPSAEQGGVNAAAKRRKRGPWLQELLEAETKGRAGGSCEGRGDVAGGDVNRKARLSQGESW